MNEVIHHVVGTCGDSHPSLLSLGDLGMTLSPGQEFYSFLMEKLGFLKKVSYFKEKDMKISIYCAVSDLSAIINIAEGNNEENTPKAFFNQSQVDVWDRSNLIEVMVDKDEYTRLIDAGVFENKIVL